MKTETQILPERVKRDIQSRFSPIRGLTPDLLSYRLDHFRVGYLRDIALTWDAIEERDDTIKSVAPKRKKAVSRLAWEILTLPDLPEAQKAEAERHAEVLRFFYNNLRCVNALDQNERGSFKLLVRQMMDSVGKRYAAHEIVWVNTPRGLTAEFRFVPLWFFENRTGKLRFLPSEGASDGIPLEEGQWMVTCGDGIMQACSVAYMFKNMSLKDWVLYNEKHGMPGVQGKTDAAKDSPEWTAMEEAVAAIAADFSCVTSRTDEILPIDLSTQGELPYPPLVERMDRAIITLWRGADLGTMSKGQGLGATLQAEETDLLLLDDAELISETLNIYVDPWVIRYVIGEVEPLAYVRLCVQDKQDVKSDLEVDRFLLESGAPLAIDATLERYGRSRPDPEEELLTKPAPAPAFGAPRPGPGGLPFANEADKATPKLLKKAYGELARAQAATLQPLRTRIASILQIENETAQRNAIRVLKNDLPQMLRSMNTDPDTAKVIEDTLAAALLNGAATAAANLT